MVLLSSALVSITEKGKEHLCKGLQKQEGHDGPVSLNWLIRVVSYCSNCSKTVVTVVFSYIGTYSSFAI